MMSDDVLLENVASSALILGGLFLENPKDDSCESLFLRLTDLSSLDGWPFGDPLCISEAWSLISEGLSSERRSLCREYQRLFVGPYHFNAPAWGSVYLDKDRVILGSSTVELCKWMKANGIVITDTKKEPEDHIGRMLALLAWLASEKPHLIEEYLANHLMTWAPRYLELLEEDARQPFYKGLALLTRTTLDDLVNVFGVKVKAAAIYF